MTTRPYIDAQDIRLYLDPSVWTGYNLQATKRYSLKDYLKTRTSTTIKRCKLTAIPGTNIFCIIKERYITNFKNLNINLKNDITGESTDEITIKDIKAWPDSHQRPAPPYNYNHGCQEPLTSTLNIRVRGTHVKQRKRPSTEDNLAYYFLNIVGYGARTHTCTWKK